MHRQMGERFGSNSVIDVLKGSSNRNKSNEVSRAYNIRPHEGICQDTLKEIISVLFQKAFYP